MSHDRKTCPACIDEERHREPDLKYVVRGLENRIMQLENQNKNLFERLSKLENKV